ncbi:MAG: F0F1 ATP synthase subunit delta [Rhodobacteraceae bacterium]|nr:F0F1 ATP synthase subunit delta [Paracoccaceae bacterium]MCF8514170.1 F0F1 ATP synthase subunit delta [Paracoccaceae bacterium]MCF8518414.1 F0F1 ATP synthase subunit delta [Paracoccaceae bacterium]
MSFDYWTLGFQAVNVLVLIWLLHRFFWKPVSGMIAQRQTNAASLLLEAEATRAKAEAALAKVAATRDGLASEREAMLAAAQAEAKATRATLLEETRAEVDTLNDAAKAARLRAAKTLKETAVEDAQGLAVTIASQLAARLTGEAVEAAFLGWLEQGIADLSADERDALGKGSSLDLVCATDPDEAAQERIKSVVAKALGAEPELRFRTDPSLIAGFEVHSPHFSLRNSWSADLARLSQALADSRKDLPPPDETQTDAA